MKASLSAAAIAFGLLASLALAPAEAAKKRGGGSVCYEQGCTGDKCIVCQR